MKTIANYVPVHSIKTREMRPLGFDIIDLGQKSGKVYDSSVPHRHTFFELFLFEKTGGSHEIDFSTYPIKKNSLHLVTPGQIHHMKQDQSKGFVVCFAEEFIFNNDSEFFIDKFPFFESAVHELDQKICNELVELVTALHRDYKIEGLESKDLLQGYLNIILTKLKKYLEKDAPDRPVPGSQKATVLRYKRLVNNSFQSHLPLAQYASQLNVSPNYLNALCKKHEGRTAIEILQERLLLESKRLLSASNLQIKEIAFLLNFLTVPYFNRFFKKHTGKTPLDFRLQANGQLKQQHQ